MSETILGGVPTHLKQPVEVIIAATTFHVHILAMLHLDSPERRILSFGQAEMSVR